MMRLFGGKEEYEKLPELEADHAEFIKIEQLNAPIMRGKDTSGRNFFTIRFKRKGDREMFCQTFRESRQGSDWFSIPSTHTIIDDKEWHPTPDGMLIDPKGFKTLENVIKNRKNDVFEIA